MSGLAAHGRWRALDQRDVEDLRRGRSELLGEVEPGTHDRAGCEQMAGDEQDERLWMGRLAVGAGDRKQASQHP